MLKHAHIKESNRNTTLGDAASMNEDLIEFALAGNADKVAEKVAAMQKALSTLRPLLDEKTFEVLTHRTANMKETSTKNGILGTALEAVEAYRAIENAMDASGRTAPAEVAMLDYSGFKLSILAAVPTVDWAMIDSTAKESDKFWSILTKQVQDKSMRNLVVSIQDGLRGAVERKEIGTVKFAAKMQLEVVDVLEQYFKNNNTIS